MVLTEADVKKMTVSKLKDALRNLNLDTSGLKPVLMDRLLATISAPPEVAEADEPAPTTTPEKPTPAKSGGRKSSATPGAAETGAEAKPKRASRITRDVSPVSKLASTPPPPAPPEGEASDLGKSKPVLGKADPKKSIGYAKIYSVRIGTKGLLSCLSRQWGAQEWKTEHKADLSVRLKRMDGQGGVADTLIVDLNNEPLQVTGDDGAKVDFRFSLARLSALDIHNGTCKLEFLGRADDKYTQPPGGPLVVLTFDKQRVLTIDQFNFLAEISRKVTPSPLPPHHPPPCSHATSHSLAASHSLAI